MRRLRQPVRPDRISIERFVNQVFCGDALKLLRLLPTASVDAVITDAMYGTASRLDYDWGREPAKGDPVKHWQYHQPIYEECRRVLRPNGILAWGQGFKFASHYGDWFGPHRIWSPMCWTHGLNFIPNTWVVQTKEQRRVEHPNDMLVYVDRSQIVPLKNLHPCPKPVEEMALLIKALTKPDQIVLDCFCGLGSTLLAAEQLGRRWIGCDLSRTYCQVAMKRLADLRQEKECTRTATATTNSEPNGRGKSNSWFVPGEGNQSWQTPPDLFEKLHSIFHFTVDAAASKSNSLLPRYWTEEQDALRQDWSQETVFCNPPFNNIAPFLVKARTAKTAIVLVWLNVLTSPYFLNQSADYIIIPKGRVKYVTTSRKASPYFSTCFLLYGKLSRTQAAAVTSQGWQCFLNHEPFDSRWRCDTCKGDMV